MPVVRVHCVLANGVGYHDLLYDSTGEAKLLSDVGSFTASSNMLIHIHGSLMIVAWMGTTSIAILLARYYKQTWVHSRMCGKDHWFAVSFILFTLYTLVLIRMLNPARFHRVYR